MLDFFLTSPLIPLHALRYTYSCGVPGCEHRCEHLRHGRDLMSDRTSGAWSACSLDGLTAWKRPKPTKWTVVVIFCARATNHENEVFSAKIAISSPCAIFDHNGPFRRLGAFPGCKLI